MACGMLMAKLNPIMMTSLGSSGLEYHHYWGLTIFSTCECSLGPALLSSCSFLQNFVPHFWHLHIISFYQFYLQTVAYDSPRSSLQGRHSDLFCFLLVSLYKHWWLCSPPSPHTHTASKCGCFQVLSLVQVVPWLPFTFAVVAFAFWTRESIFYWKHTPMHWTMQKLFSSKAFRCLCI